MTGELRSAGRRALAALTVSSLGVAGCGSAVATLSFPAPPPSGSPRTAVAPPADYSGVSQPTVAGSTTTSVPAIGPGAATIDGSIIGPSGPVAGATVQADRLVNGRVTSTQAMTGADGSFAIGNILGGIYRVRAWQAPSLALTTPQVFFLGGADTHAVSLTLSSFLGVVITTSMAPGSVFVGDPANVVVAVSQQTVGADGVVRPTPQVGQTVSLDGGGGWSTDSGPSALTDASGHAAFRVTCESAAAPALIATVNGSAPVTVRTATCSTPPPPTTTTLPSPPGAPGVVPGSPSTTSSLGQPPVT